MLLLLFFFFLFWHHFTYLVIVLFYIHISLGSSSILDLFFIGCIIPFMPLRSEKEYHPNMFSGNQDLAKALTDIQAQLAAIEAKLNDFTHVITDRMDSLENSRVDGSVGGEDHREANVETLPYNPKGRTPVGHFNQRDLEDMALRSVKVETSQFDGKPDPKAFLD